MEACFMDVLPEQKSPYPLSPIIMILLLLFTNMFGNLSGRFLIGWAASKYGHIFIDKG